MIIVGRRSVRSLWSPFVTLIGLTFALLGLAMMTMPKEPGVTQPTYVSGLVIGAACFVLGLPFIWGGVRMGVIRDGQCLRVRQLLSRKRIFCPPDITGFTIGAEEHHSLPLMVIQPGIVLADGSEVQISGLATYHAIPGSTRRVQSVVGRLADWTGRPVL